MFCGVTSGFKIMLRKTNYKLNVNLIRNLSQIMDAEKATGQKAERKSVCTCKTTKISSPRRKIYKALKNFFLKN